MVSRHSKDRGGPFLGGGGGFFFGRFLGGGGRAGEGLGAGVRPSENALMPWWTDGEGVAKPRKLRRLGLNVSLS